MNNKRILFLFLSLFAGFFLSSCSGKAPGKESGQGGKLKVFVSVLPQAYFAERIGGNNIEVGVLVGPGQSPHSFEPAPRQVAALSESQMYFTTKMPFEETLVRKIMASNKNLRIVDTTRGIEMLHMSEEDIHGEESGNGREQHRHAEGEIDPHIWMSPRNAAHQAEVMFEAMQEIDPEHAAEYEKNYIAVKLDLEKLDKKLAGLLLPYNGKEFFVFHPAFGYFGQAYNLKQISVETGGKEPGPRGLSELIARAKKDNVKIIFVQPQFSSKSAEAVAGAIGGTILRIDPLAKDYISNMEMIAEELTGSLEKSN